jgi:hypothetical protein
MMTALPLSGLLSRSVNLRWYEGVAIVRGVAQLLLDQHGTDGGIPELHQIELAADGSLAIDGGSAAGEPVRRFGQLLQAMLTEADGPVQLRLFVFQATAPIPAYASLAEFDQALAYFERPNRTALLKAVYERAVAAAPTTGPDRALTLDAIAPLPETKPLHELAPRKNPRRLGGMAVALLAVLAASGAAAVYLRHAGVTANGRELSRVTTVAANAIGATVLAGASAVSDSVGLGRLVTANAADAKAGPRVAEAESAPRTAWVSAPRRRMKGIPAIARLDEPADADAANLTPRTAVVYDDPDDRVSAVESLIRETDALVQSVDETIHFMVYTPGDDGVSPPIGLRSQLPQQLPPMVDRAALSRIELIIGTDGSVESVKLLGTRRDVMGGMFLSAAKAWEFQPATKDGVAVRYRKTILVSFE